MSGYSNNNSRIPKATGSNHSSGFTSFPSPSNQYTTSPRALPSLSPRNASGPSVNGTPTSYRPNNTFAQRQHSPQPQAYRQPAQHPGYPSTGYGGPTAPLSVNGRRRPSEMDVDKASPSASTPISRRPVPPQSPEVSSLPRLSSLAASPRPMPTPHPSPRSPQTQRAASRQPSTPSSATHSIPRKPVTDPIPTRGQATSTPPTLTSTPTAVDRVPPHIRSRLRLIQQLGDVLSIDSTAVTAKIDVPGLLARVDAAYVRGYGAGQEVPAVAGSPVGLPLELGASRSHSGDEKQANRDSKTGGMLGMFKRMGGVGKQKNPAEEISTYSPRAEG